MLRIDVPVWFNAVCYMSVTVQGQDIQNSTFGIRRTFHDRGGIPKHGLEDWNGAGVAHEGGDGC